ncbi:hypothetical protein J4E91_005950 [Alternaria rosae]|nr:hypothetical protein J4E91_005950 [Alternaria rosae]
MQFFIGAGAVLLVLAIMYWFIKIDTTKYEFGEIINRVIVGFTLIVLEVSAVIMDKTTSGFKFKGSHWMIPIVVLFFTAVLFLNNVLLAVAQYTSRHPRHSHKRDISWGSRTLHIDSDDNENGGLICKYPSRAPSPGGTPKGAPRRGSNTPTPLLNRVQTAYIPFADSPPQRYDFAAGPSNSKVRMPSRSRDPAFDSEVTLRDEGNYV